MPVLEKSGNLLNAPRIYIYIYIYIKEMIVTNKKTEIRIIIREQQSTNEQPFTSVARVPVVV